MKYFVIILLAYLIPCHAADITQKNKKNQSKLIEKSVRENIQEKKPQEWKPEPFDISLERLPTKYDGVDVSKFHALIKTKFKYAYKSQLETSDEYEKRITSNELLPPPLDANHLYAFRVEEFERSSGFSYELKKQAFITSQYGYSCRKHDDKIIAKVFKICDIADANRTSEDYIGSNAYGATRSVRSVRYTKLGFALQPNHPLISKHMMKESVILHGFQDSIPVPLEKAKTLPSQLLISVLFVGQILSPQIILGPTVLIRATLDAPTEIYAPRESIPFDIKKVIYYIRETGEILAVRNLYSDTNPNP